MRYDQPIILWFPSGGIDRILHRDRTKSDRPELTVALDACRRHQAVLIIAKLDSLASKVYFIT